MVALKAASRILSSGEGSDLPLHGLGRGRCLGLKAASKAGSTLSKEGMLGLGRWLCLKAPSKNASMLSREGMLGLSRWLGLGQCIARALHEQMAKMQNIEVNKLNRASLCYLQMRRVRSSSVSNLPMMMAGLVET